MILTIYKIYILNYYFIFISNFFLLYYIFRSMGKTTIKSSLSIKKTTIISVYNTIISIHNTNLQQTRKFQLWS